MLAHNRWEAHNNENLKKDIFTRLKQQDKECSALIVMQR